MHGHGSGRILVRLGLIYWLPTGPPSSLPGLMRREAVCVVFSSSFSAERRGQPAGDNQPQRILTMPAKKKIETTKPSRSDAPTGSSPPVYEGVGLTHPCGHWSSHDDACLEVDRFCCPECGLRWHMRQDPPIRHRSGWIEPGKRTLVIETELELPHMADLKTRRDLAKRPKAPLARVLRQAAASNHFREVTQMVLSETND